MKLFEEPGDYSMSRACKSCGSWRGRIVEKGSQDCVYCADCDRLVYNASRTETGKAVRSASTVHAAIKPKKRARILERANRHCELCGKGGALHVGHLLSVKVGLEQGLTDVELNGDENLCAMCDECNLGIGSNPVPLRLAVSMVMARLRRGEGS